MPLDALLRPPILIAALWILLPLLLAGFAPGRIAAWVNAVPQSLRLAAPALLCVPYALVAHTFHIFRWEWLALYAL
jgi:hypothetical protein